MDVETAWSLVCCNLCTEDKFACPRMPGYGYLRTHVAGTHIGHKHQGMDKYCMEKCFFLGFMLTIFMHVDANIRKCVRICVYAPVLSHCVFMFPSACSSCIDYDCGL